MKPRKSLVKTNYSGGITSLKYASNETILKWCQRQLPDGSFIGEVTGATVTHKKNETITIVGGLYCQAIFGPIQKDDCACGRLAQLIRRNRLNENERGSWVCPVCQVQWVDPIVRRSRMGYIELFSTIVHPWVLHGSPNYLALLLQMSRKDLHSLALYRNEFFHYDGRAYTSKFNSKIISNYNSKLNLPTLPKNSSKELSAFSSLDSFYKTRFYFQQTYKPTNAFYTGGQAIRKMLTELNVEKEYENMLESIRNSANTVRWNGFQNISDLKLDSNSKQTALGGKLNQSIKRLKLLKHILHHDIDLTNVTIQYLPVLPPSLRPLIQLPNGQLAISDLTLLYQRVATRNQLYQTSLTNKIEGINQTENWNINRINNFRSFLLQEAVDRLFDNSKCKKPLAPPKDLNPWAASIKMPVQPYRSLTDNLRGKQGRFRQYLLGKRVDYSGRSVIISGPELRFPQCGLPYEMALALFQPLLLAHFSKGIRNRRFINSFRQAKQLMQKNPAVFWHLLEFYMAEQVVVLNRAPTLHRFGIQAFEPTLVPGRAIMLHPIVCPAFNADFDGDQMAVHVPVSFETQAEARVLLMATQNLLTPATGSPIAVLSQDMVLGCYYLTMQSKQKTYRRLNSITNSQTDLPLFGSLESLTLAYHQQRLSLQSLVWFKWPNSFVGWDTYKSPIEVRIGARGSRIELYESCQRHYNRWGVLVEQYIQTSVGRALFNRAVLPVLNPLQSD